MHDASHSPGGTGRLFPDATLPVLAPQAGRTITLDAFRPKSDLVMLMLGADRAPREVVSLLDALTAERTDVEAEDGRVLAVTAADASADWRWPFPLLFDRDGRLHRRVGAVDAAGRPVVTLFTTDRYREIYGAMRPGDRTWPQTARDLIDWLVFANIQCPECNPPESGW